MVVGYIIDGVTALVRGLKERRQGSGNGDEDDKCLRRRGVLNTSFSGGVSSRGVSINFLLCQKLSLWQKWAFWLTNAPFWILCVLLFRSR